MKKGGDSDHLSVNEILHQYNNFKDFKTLDAWKKCQEVKIYFYKVILPKLPEEEKFNLGIQIRKAAISITSNIAEGYGRYHFREGIQFYRISRASLYELKDHLISCKDLEFISLSEYETGLKIIEIAKVVLNGFINFVYKKLK